MSTLTFASFQEVPESGTRKNKEGCGLALFGCDDAIVFLDACKIQHDILSPSPSFPFTRHFKYLSRLLPESTSSAMVGCRGRKTDTDKPDSLTKVKPELELNATALA